MKKLTTSVLTVVLSSSFAVVSAQTVQDSTKTQDIEEVMVVGYSKVNRNDFVGTASQVDMKSLDNKAATNVSQALAGEVAGVRVINLSGQPGANADIRVRGFGSVNGNRSPLYILDGTPYEGNISVINPDDIESMTVLKDASATAIYGARGANGVVIINTKRGKANRSNIQIESKIGINTALIPRYDVVSSPEEYIALAWEGLYNQARVLGNANPTNAANNGLFGGTGINAGYNLWNVPGANLIDPNTRQVRDGVTRKYNPENWRDYAFKPGLRSETNLSMSGGADKTTYYTSFGYLKDEGYSINSNFERYTTRMNLGFQPKSWLKGQFNMGYAFTKSKNNGQTSDSGSIFWFADNIPSIYPLFLKDANGNNVYDPRVGDVYDYGNQAGKSRGFGLGTNAIADATYNLNQYRKHELNFNANMDATLAQNLTFETRFAGQYYNNNRDLLTNPFYGSAVATGGSLYKTKAEMFTWNFLQLLRYKNRFGSHGLEAFVAHESNTYEYRFLAGSKAGLVDPNIPEFNNSITNTGLNSYIYDYKLESYFGQVTYDFDNKYLLQASIRRDGSSRFLQDKWDVFPSVGLGWVLSREGFINNDIFPLLKLKASYGLVGDQALVGSNAPDQNIGYYPGYNVYDVGSMMGAIATSFNRYGYPNLTWEKKKKFQTGIEFSLFKNRIIEGAVDYYRDRTNNLIFDTRLSPSTGEAIRKANSGALLNEGIEFSITGHILKKKDFFLDLTINGEHTRNKMLEMPFDPATLSAKILDVSGEAGYGRAQGYSIYDYYMREWAGVNSQTGAGQWVQHYVDVNGNGQFDAGDQNILSLYEFQKANPNAVISQGVTENYALATQKFVGKSAIPDLRGAVNLAFGYKNFAIGAQMLYSIGGYSYDAAYGTLMGNMIAGNGNWHKDIHNSWKNPGDITDIPRLSNANGTDINYGARSTRFLTKSDYLLLNNVNVSYTFTKDVLMGTGLNNLTLSVAGDNLWLKSKRKGFNPVTSETGQSDVYNYAPLSTLTFGVKANF